MKEFIQQKSQKAYNKYLELRENYELLIKNAVETSAEIGLNTACITVQATWNEMKIIERYLGDLGCRVTKSYSNYSWKYITFNF